MSEPTNPERVTFRWLSHCCKDLEKTSRFYQEVMGFTLRNARDSKGDNVAKLLRMSTPFQVNLVFLQKDGLVLELQGFEYHNTEPGPDFVMTRLGWGLIHLDCKNLPEILERVPAYGGEILEDTNTGGSVLVKDPDGAILELIGLPG